ncbi:predicted protein [Arabidopsis lyrata subsp. lyrata]|uniref:Predicted protein n=1 Tax=Arabidopsis lyrata subsp. lyrata TaxID=81972 RepID=D7LGS8_ARALL|nr:predicted protein [Arabidopsis lyrata subsp. lyrata]
MEEKLSLIRLFYEPGVGMDAGYVIPSQDVLLTFINNFTGPINFGNTSSSSNLSGLDLSGNKFDGPIPESISKFLKLESLDISNNSFSGRFPTSLFKIPSLQWDL